MRHPIIMTTLGLALSGTAVADWTLDGNHSRLSFVSTKAGNVAEVHRFTDLSGRLQDDGRLEITVNMDSVDTAIAIRDERMRELLFETERWPEASILAQLDMAALGELAVGDQGELTAEAQLDVHGETVNITISADVARLDSATLVATSSQPLVVNAGQLGLADGIEKLRDIAGLPSISPAVPVTFRLTLRQDDAPR